MEDKSAVITDNTPPAANLRDKKFVPKKEMWMFGIATLGQGMIYAIMSSYISDFYINVLQVPLLFVLLLMLLARIWDAINDPLMGMIVDRVDTRWGKMKPYVLFTALPIAVLTFLMFFDPQLPPVETMVYAAFVYVFWGMIYTASDVPFWSLPNVLTPSPSERANIISFGRTLNGIGSAFPMVMFTLLGFILPYVSDATGITLDKQKYMIMAIACSVIGIILFVNSYFHVKERVKIPRTVTHKVKGEPGVLKRIFTCKPLMLVVIMGILSSGRYMMQAAAIHVARYAFYIGPDLATATHPTAALQSSITIVNIVFTVCSAIGMFGSMLLMPYFYKKFNYKQIIFASCIGGFVASAVVTVLGALSIFLDRGFLFYICIPFIIIQCIPLGALNVTSYAMVGDCLDYMEWKTGFRDNALGSACQSFVNKLGNALATTLIILMYIIISLNPADIYAGEAVVAATDLAKNQRFAIFSLVSIIPGISLILCAIPILFYDITGEKKDRIVAELHAMREEKGITIDE